MTYLTLSGIVVTVAAVLGWGITWRSRRETAGDHWLAVLLAGILLVVLTAIFDSLMIASDLFYYAENLITGVYLGLAPIEDFAYPIAGVLVLPAMWWFLTSPAHSSRVSSIRRGLSAFFAASRPVSWINTAFPFAAAQILITREITWVTVVGTLYFLIPYNVALYGINDVFDYASDRLNPRKGSVEGALVPPNLHRPLLVAAAITNVPFLLALAVFGGASGGLALTISVFALLAYSVPKLRFKERPVLDSITSAAHFVSPAVVGVAMTGERFSPELIITLAAFFLWSMAAHAFGAVQDVLPDRAAGLSSIATVYGARNTVRISLLLWTAAGVLMLFTSWPGPLAAAIVVPYLANCGPWWRVSDEESHRTNKAWKRFIWLNYVCGFFVTMLLIAVWHTH